MGLEGEKKTRKDPSRNNVINISNDQSNENSKKSSNKQHPRNQDLLQLQVLDVNSGKKFKISSARRQESYVEQEGELIFQTSNLNSPNLPSPNSTASFSVNLPNSSFSINLPSSSHSSLSINLPPHSHSGFALKIHSSPGSSSSVSSNTPLTLKDEETINNNNNSNSNNGALDCKKGGNIDSENGSPVLELVQESCPLISDSVTKSPPLPQIMDRSSEGYDLAGNIEYDPNRIPLAIFEKNGSSPIEWSVASNDSLFSLKLGKTNSLSRDQIISMNEFKRLEGIDFAFSPPLPIAMAGAEISPTISFEETSEISLDIDSIDQANEVINKIQKEVNEALDNIEKNDEIKKKPKKIDKHKTSGGDIEDNWQSFAFPILTESDEKEKPCHPETIVVKDHLQNELNEQHAIACLNEQQDIVVPIPSSPSKISATKPKLKSKSKSFFHCISCNKFLSCFSRRHCRPCSSSCWPSNCCSSSHSCSHNSLCSFSCWPSNCCSSPSQSCSHFSCSLFICSSSLCHSSNCFSSSCRPCSCFSCRKWSCSSCHSCSFPSCKTWNCSSCSLKWCSFRPCRRCLCCS